MRFEETVVSIWGKPKTAITFAGYYHLKDQTAFKAILLSLCIYSLNYDVSKYDDESVEALQNYESLAEKNESTYQDDIRILKLLYKHNYPFPQRWE